MVTLAASVLSPMAVTLIPKSRRARFSLLIGVLLFIEYLPASLPATPTGFPNYVTALAGLRTMAVCWTKPRRRNICSCIIRPHTASRWRRLVARTPSSVVEKEKGLKRAINRGNYAALWDTYGFDHCH